MEEKSCRRSRGRHLEAERPRRHPGASGSIQEAPRRSPGEPQDIPRDPQEAARMPPGGPQRHSEGAQRHPGGSQRTRGVFDAKCAKTIVLYSKNNVRDHFRVDGSDVTLTKSAACAQK